MTLCCKSCFDDSDVAAQIRLGRTKCSAIIKNVLAPYFTKELKKDVGDRPFSVLIDESTDVGVIKHLGFAIRYYSVNKKRIENLFLTLVTIEKCDAETLAQAVKDVIKQFDLPLQNLIGIGVDNAAVMVGIHTGVYTRLKAEIPGLILIPCVCHSLQLAISEACKNS